MQFNSIKDVVTNPFFQAWYYKNEPRKAKEWECMVLDHPELVGLITQGCTWMKEHFPGQQSLSKEQVAAAWEEEGGIMNKE